MGAYKLRLAIGSDLNFIYSTWLDSYRYDSSLGKSCRNSTFYPSYQLVIDHILARASVVVVCMPDQEKVIFGYLVYEPKILHYCFVKQAFRELGLAGLMWREAICPLVHTHKTLGAEPILLNHKEFVFNPFMLFKGVE
jgi:hypothetical protein